jgi:hypothetical protein
VDTPFSSSPSAHQLNVDAHAPTTTGSTNLVLPATSGEARDVSPSWLPDWRDPSQYPDSAASRLDWAWQFLRRNPGYQKLWLERVAPTYNPAYVARSFQRTAGVARQDLDGFHRRPLMVHGGPHNDQPIFRKRFGVITIPQDPSEAKASVRFEAQSVQYARSRLRRPPAVLQDHEVLICLDLRLPIKTQLKNVKQLVAQELKSQKLNNTAFRFRFRADKYRRYLQLLDARAVGASSGEIAEVFYGNSLGYDDKKKRVRQDRKVAEALRDNPWRIVAGGE